VVSALQERLRAATDHVTPIGLITELRRLFFMSFEDSAIDQDDISALLVMLDLSAANRDILLKRLMTSSEDVGSARSWFPFYFSIRSPYVRPRSVRSSAAFLMVRFSSQS
jgi:hypothetical protein